jgi:hypothetical protein
VLDERAPKQLASHAVLLKKLSAKAVDKSVCEGHVLLCVERLLAVSAHAPALAAKKSGAAGVLKVLYDADVLCEEAILSWHAAPCGPHGTRVRQAVAPFVTWLQEAEEEDDDEYE